MRFFTLLLLLFCCSNPVTAQNEARNREIGLRASGLEDLDFIYKKSLAEDTYRRYRFFAGNFDFTNIDGSSIATFSVGASIGKEQRKLLADKLGFVYGPEFRLGLNLLASDDDVFVSISPGFGYVLGFQYNVSERFYFGVETIPGVSLTYGNGFTQLINLSAGFDSNAVSVVGVYRFYK